MNMKAAARLLLQAADGFFCTDDSGLKMFVWFQQVAGDRQSAYNVVAGAVNGPLKEMAKLARGYSERATGTEIFDVFRESVNGRPFLPSGRKPERGMFFQAAMCIEGVDGSPIDSDGNRLEIPPKDAVKYEIMSAEAHLVSPHWTVEGQLA